MMYEMEEMDEETYVAQEQEFITDIKLLKNVKKMND